MKKFPLFTLGIALALTAVSYASLNIMDAGPKVGEQAPEITGKTIEGKDFKLKEMNDKLVLVDFWATWCPPCKIEIPHLQAAYKKYRDQGLEIVSVDVNEDVATIKNFTEKYPMPWIHLTDSDGSLSKKYSVHGIPSPYLIDHTGKIVAKGEELRMHHLGKTLEKHIQNLPKKEVEPKPEEA